VVTWLESIKSEAAGGLEIEWKTFSLEQQNSSQPPEFKFWEHPELPNRGVSALVAAKAAKNQGEDAFLRFHMAAFNARHDQGKDIADQEVLQEIGQTAKLDMARFKQDYAGAETWEAVGNDHQESQDKYEMFGVPTLVFDSDEAVFVKLASLPDSMEERLSLFDLVSGMGAEKPYLLELKRP
jgi:predicted DsbA family dithiol-disulfide isomerase